MTSNIYPTEI